MISWAGAIWQDETNAFRQPGSRVLSVIRAGHLSAGSTITSWKDPASSIYPVLRRQVSRPEVPGRKSEKASVSKPGPLGKDVRTSYIHPCGEASSQHLLPAQVATHQAPDSRCSQQHKPLCVHHLRLLVDG